MWYSTDVLFSNLPRNFLVNIFDMNTELNMVLIIIIIIEYGWGDIVRYAWSS